MSQPNSRANQFPRMAPTTSSPAAIRRSGLLQPPSGEGEAATTGGLRLGRDLLGFHGLLGGRWRYRLFLRLLRPRWPEQIGDLHAAGEPRDALTERCALDPPPVGLGRTAAEFLGARRVRRRGRVEEGVGGGGLLGLGGARARYDPAQALRQPPAVLRLVVPLHRHLGGGPLRGGAAARGRHDLVGAAEPGEDAADGGGTVDGSLRPAPIDLAPQLRHQAHARGRRQLTLLGHVADAAQILVDDLVALDPHEVPSGAGVLDTPRPRR